MSKYTIANTLIEQALTEAGKDGIKADELLLALLVATVESYKQAAGPKLTRDALKYELDNVSGGVDTVFLRSR